jgi:hypothetical protein
VNSARERTASWWIYLGVPVVAFLIGAGVRLLEAPRWDTQSYSIDGEHLLATHDAYAWVSGAEWSEAYTAGTPMALLLAFLSNVTKIRSANLAFWLPAVLAGLSAIPLAFWAAYLGARPGASLACGVLGSLVPAFYSRTRLGYYDTDWATLFFPLLVSLLLAIWIRPYLRGAEPEMAPGIRGNRAILNSVPLMIVVPLSLAWHGYLHTYAISILWLALGLLLVWGKQDSRAEALRTLLAFTLAVGGGWTGACVGILLLLLLSRLPLDLLNSPWGRRVALGLSAGLLLLFTGLQFRDFLPARIARYSGNPGVSYGGVAYPDPGLSVRETQDVSPAAALEGAAFAWWLGVAGLLGYGWLIVKRPPALLLAPLLFMGILSVKLGVRFAMFAAPVLCLGALVPVDWWLAGPKDQKGRRVILSSALFVGLLAVVVPIIQREYARMPIETVLTRDHAAALRTLRSEAGSEGLVWTWWDYGYATQYFSGLPTFADGSRNSGKHVFTLGSVLGSEDLESSARLATFSAAHQGTPWSVWEGWQAETLDAWFGRLPESAGRASAPFPQYLVVQWDAISFLPWIQYFGSWNFEGQTGQRSGVTHFSQPLELDLERGTFLERGGQAFVLSTADLLDQSGSKHHVFPEYEGGPHLLMRMDSFETYLLDDRAYRSTLVQLLLEPGSSFGEAGSYELLVDGTPDVRLFRLR